MTLHLTFVESLAIHQDQISRYGGNPGLRDAGLLEAALFRPQTGYFPDLIAEAEALWESRPQNQPFVDGNKRTAFTATFTFLAVNGVVIKAYADAVRIYLEALYGTGQLSFDPCLSGCHPHPLNVGCTHSPEYSPSKVGAAAPPAIPSSERNALNG